jgi:hypothetical protein
MGKRALRPHLVHLARYTSELSRPTEGAEWCGREIPGRGAQSRGTLGSAATRREGAHVFLIESYDPFRDWRGTLENVRDLIGPS